MTIYLKLALGIFILLHHANCDSHIFLNISVMPRSDTLARGKDASAASRGFKIDPQYMLGDSSELTKEGDELIHKLIGDAIEFFKTALKLKQPVKKSGILLSRTCEYTTGRGVIYAGNDPVLSACPERCGAKTFCGPRIEVPSRMLADCVEQYYSNQILSLLPYDANPNEEPDPTDADFILFVDVQKDPTSQLLVSENSFCQLDLTTYRPIAGFVTFNTLVLAEYRPVDYEMMLAQVKHTLCHLLGFSMNILGLSPSLNEFSYTGYRDTNEERLPWDRLQLSPFYVFTPVHKVLKKVATETGGTTYQLSTPKVLETARSYFNCPTLESIELEDQNPDIAISGKRSNIAGSHWDQRVLPEEIMSMSSFDSSLPKHFRPKFSNFTLAYFEDLGWYEPNYAIAEEMAFGKNAGCNFVKERSCPTLIEEYPNSFCSPSYFEFRRNYEKCHPNMKSVTRCSINTYEDDLAHEFIYFGNKKVSGSFYSNYCPLLGPQKRPCTEIDKSYLTSLETPPLETTARCVEISDNSCENKKDTESAKHAEIETSCQTVLCFADSYQIPNFQITCHGNGQKVRAVSKEGDGSCSGYFTCPPCELMCSNCSIFNTRSSLQTSGAPLVFKLSSFLLLINALNIFL